jgi:uridylate kinase
MKKWVISLGGSRIAPKDNQIDYIFINKLEKIINQNPKTKFIIVTGGGSTARRYIKALKKLDKSTKIQSKAGIGITRFHAGFLARVLGKKANEVIPKNLKKVKNLLNKNQVVFCGALRYKEKQTSDGTAADIAAYLKSSFINITNVKGLYTSNPKTHKNAKFIKKITWKAFYNKAKKIKFKAGQHFVLDQNAAKTIMEKKIPTYIIGDLKDLENIIKNRKFKGSLIKG